MFRRELFPSRSKQKDSKVGSKVANDSSSDDTNANDDALSPLTEVTLARQNLSSETMKAIGELIQHTPSINLVDLSLNDICADGVRLLLDNLGDTGCPTLTSLSIANNRIGDEGAAHLCELLLPNSRTPQLKLLNIDSNDIGPLGGQKIAKALQHNTTLTSLSLSHNPLHAGAISICLSLQSNANTCLQELYLSDIQADEAVGQHLALLLAHNTTLSVLDISSNPECSPALASRIDANIYRRWENECIAIRELSSCESFSQLTFDDTAKEREEHLQQVLEQLRESVLSQPIGDYCLELTKLLLEYYDYCETEIQMRLEEIHPTNGGGSISSNSMQTQQRPHASMTVSENEGFVPVRKRKGSRARKEEKEEKLKEEKQQKEKKPSSFARFKSSLQSSSSSSSVVNGSVLKDSFSGNDSGADFSSGNVIAEESSQLLDPASIPAKVKLWIYLKLFPLRVNQLAQGLQKFKATRGSTSSMEAVSPSSPSVFDPFKPSSLRDTSLWEGYTALQLLVGVVLLRAEKAMAASRARDYLESELQRIANQHRRAPHNYRGGVHGQMQASSQNEILPQRGGNKSMPTTPLRGNKGVSNSDSISTPTTLGQGQADAANQLPHPHYQQQQPQQPQLVYPMTTLLFEANILAQLQDSFHVLLHLSLCIKSCILFQLTQLVHLAQLEDLEILDHIYRIVSREFEAHEGGSEGDSNNGSRELRLLDELTMAKKWTKVPALISADGFSSHSDSLFDSPEDTTSSTPLVHIPIHGAVRGPMRSSTSAHTRVSFLRQVYGAVEEAIAARFDRLFEEDSLDPAVAAQTLAAKEGAQPVFLKVEEMGNEEAESIHGRGSQSSHQRVESVSVNQSFSVAASPSLSISQAPHGASVSSAPRDASASTSTTGPVAARPIAPLLESMKGLLKDLRSLKQTLAPLTTRTRRERKQKEREKKEAAESSTTMNRAPPSSRNPAVRPGASEIADVDPNLNIETFDLFSFCFERYHQRLMLMFISPRFQPNFLSLPDIFTAVSWLGFYSGFLKQLFVVERVNEAHKSRRAALSALSNARGSLLVPGSQPRISDMAMELEAYSDRLLDEWIARQTEKSKPWWRNISEADWVSEPEKVASQDFDHEEAEISVTSHRRAASNSEYYATNAPQDLFTKLNAFGDLALDTFALRGRALYRVAGMLVQMAQGFIQTHQMSHMKNMRNKLEEFTSLYLASSLEKMIKDKDKEKNEQDSDKQKDKKKKDDKKNKKDKLKDGADDKKKEADSEKEASSKYPIHTPTHLLYTGLLRISTLNKSHMQKLAESQPVRRGTELKRKLAGIKEKDKEKEKDEKRKDKHELERAHSERDLLAEESNSSSSSSSSSLRPLSELRPSLIQLIAQLNNAAMYEYHSEKMSDLFLDKLEGERDEEEAFLERANRESHVPEDEETTGGFSSADEMHAEGGTVDESRDYIYLLQTLFDDLSDMYTDYSFQCIDTLAAICLDRCVNKLVQWSSEANMKRLFTASEKSGNGSTSASSAALTSSTVPPSDLMQSLLSMCAEFFALVIPQIRKSIQSALLIKYVFHGLVVHYVSFLLTIPKIPSSVTPHKKLLVILSWLKQDKRMIRSFFSDQPPQDDEEDEDGHEEDGDNDASEMNPDRDTDSGPSRHSQFSSCPSNHIIRPLIKLKELESSFVILQTLEDLFSADDEFLQVHFDELLKKFPLASEQPQSQQEGSSSPHPPSTGGFKRMYGLNALLLLQGCLKYRADIESKRKLAIVTQFIQCLRIQSESQAVSLSITATSSTSKPDQSQPQHKKNKKSDDSDCVIM